MSDQTQMKIADGHEPRPDWNRPQRISLLQNVLSEKRIPEAKVYLGGERFTFTHAGKFVNLNIYRYTRTGYKIVIGLHRDEESLRTSVSGSPLIIRELGRANTEEEMVAKVGELLSEIT